MTEIVLLSKLSDEWFKNPAFVREYEALEEEFALATALIEARAGPPASDRNHAQTRLP